MALGAGARSVGAEASGDQTSGVHLVAWVPRLRFLICVSVTTAPGSLQMAQGPLTFR